MTKQKNSVTRSTIFRVLFPGKTVYSSDPDLKRNIQLISAFSFCAHRQNHSENIGKILPMTGNHLPKRIFHGLYFSGCTPTGWFCMTSAAAFGGLFIGNHAKFLTIDRHISRGHDPKRNLVPGDPRHYDLDPAVNDQAFIQLPWKYQHLRLLTSWKTIPIILFIPIIPYFPPTCKKIFPILPKIFKFS